MMVNKVLLIILIFTSGFAKAQPDSIKISSQSIDREIAVREEALLRPLSQQEKETMVKNLVFDELLLFEALKLNLHLSDSEVRHRLIGIMEYTYQPRVPEPTESDLRSFYKANKSDFDQAAEYSFDHLYFKYKPDLLTTDLENDENWQQRGDEYWVNSRISNKPITEINVFLGNEVAQSIENSKQNVWTGPVKSSAGYHFIRVTGYIEPIPRSYDEVSGLVMDLWKEAKRKEKFEERMFQLMKGYKVELPDEFKGLRVE